MRPTKIGINIRCELMLSLFRNAEEIQKMVKVFHEKLPSEPSKRKKKPLKNLRKKISQS